MVVVTWPTFWQRPVHTSSSITSLLLPLLTLLALALTTGPKIHWKTVLLRTRNNKWCSDKKAIEFEKSKTQTSRMYVLGTLESNDDYNNNTALLKLSFCTTIFWRLSVRLETWFLGLTTDDWRLTTLDFKFEHRPVRPEPNTKHQTPNTKHQPKPKRITFRLYLFHTWTT